MNSDTNKTIENQNSNRNLNYFMGLLKNTPAETVRKQMIDENISTTQIDEMFRMAFAKMDDISGITVPSTLETDNVSDKSLPMDSPRKPSDENDKNDKPDPKTVSYQDVSHHDESNGSTALNLVPSVSTKTYILHDAAKSGYTYTHYVKVAKWLRYHNNSSKPLAVGISFIPGTLKSVGSNSLMWMSYQSSGGNLLGNRSRFLWRRQQMKPVTNDDDAVAHLEASDSDNDTDADDYEKTPDPEQEVDLLNVPSSVSIQEGDIIGISLNILPCENAENGPPQTQIVFSRNGMDVMLFEMHSDEDGIRFEPGKSSSNQNAGELIWRHVTGANNIRRSESKGYDKKNISTGNNLSPRTAGPGGKSSQRFVNLIEKLSDVNERLRLSIDLTSGNSPNSNISPNPTLTPLFSVQNPTALSPISPSIIINSSSSNTNSLPPPPSSVTFSSTASEASSILNLPRVPNVTGSQEGRHEINVSPLSPESTILLQADNALRSLEPLSVQFQIGAFNEHSNSSSQHESSLLRGDNAIKFLDSSPQRRTHSHSGNSRRFRSSRDRKVSTRSHQTTQIRSEDLLPSVSNIPLSISVGKIHSEILGELGGIDSRRNSNLFPPTPAMIQALQNQHIMSGGSSLIVAVALPIGAEVQYLAASEVPQVARRQSTVMENLATSQLLQNPASINPSTRRISSNTLSPESASIVTSSSIPPYLFSGTVFTRWDQNISDSELQFTASDTIARRPGSVSCYPASLIRIPQSENAYSLTMSLRQAPRGPNSMSIGIAKFGFKDHGSDGFGLSENSWGLIESRSDGDGKLYGNRIALGSFRKMREGDVFSVVYDRRVGKCWLLVGQTEPPELCQEFSIHPPGESPDLVMGATYCNVSYILNLSYIHAYICF
jgi:hypothetical protein